MDGSTFYQENIQRERERERDSYTSMFSGSRALSRTSLSLSLSLSFLRETQGTPGHTKSIGISGWRMHSLGKVRITLGPPDHQAASNGLVANDRPGQSQSSKRESEKPEYKSKIHACNWKKNGTRGSFFVSAESLFVWFSHHQPLDFACVYWDVFWLPSPHPYLFSASLSVNHTHHEGEMIQSNGHTWCAPLERVQLAKENFTADPIAPLADWPHTWLASWLPFSCEC